MNREVYEALETIGKTCLGVKGCSQCPLYYVNPNPLRDNMCVFRKTSPGGVYEHIVQTYEFDFERSKSNE